jgi:uncharacterized membrane protein
MKVLRVFMARETAVPMLAVTLASAVSILLVILRIVWTRQPGYKGLVINLFLAWLPLLFAFLAREAYKPGARASARFIVLGIAWLVFFPNAPYILTDVCHLSGWWLGHYWIDLTLILTCALTGLVLGFLSLFLMHSVVRRMLGDLAGWAFILVSSCLGGFGVYLGRSLRFHSWDVVLQPASVYHGVLDPGAHAYFKVSPLFPPFFAVFLLTTYCLFYALTYLSAAPALLRSTAADPD